MSGLGVDLHGVGISVDCDDAHLLDAVRARFRSFAPLRREADVRISIAFVASARSHVERPRGDGRPVYEPPEGSVRYFDEEDVLFVELGERLRLRCEPGRGVIAVSALESMRCEQWLLSRPMITIPLVETLKRHGLFSVHAAGVARDGRGIVLPGATGSGKSTLALALACRGLGFLSDDMVFLRRRDDGDVDVVAFPDEIDLTPSSASFFDGLPSGFLALPPSGWKKHRLSVTELAPGAELPSSSAPGVLVFPQPGAEDESALTPIGHAEALLELVPNVLLTDSVSSQEHLDALGALARRSDCYRLRTGRDFDRLATLLSAAAA